MAIERSDRLVLVRLVVMRRHDVDRARSSRSTMMMMPIKFERRLRLSICEGEVHRGKGGDSTSGAEI